MDRIKELNKKLGDKVVPYRKLTKSKTQIINENLWHFLGIGLAYAVASGVLAIQGNDGTTTGSVSPIIALALLLVSVLLIVGVSSWIINLYRAVIEKTANKDIKLTNSSFIPEFDGKFFSRGGKFLVTTLVYGLIVGLVLIIPIIIITSLIVGVFGGLFLGASSPEELIGVSMIGGFLGIIAGVILYYLIAFLIGLLISPFLLPITTLYMYYGDEIGIWEAVTLSFKLGKQNYGLLLKTSLKVTGLNILGMLLFGVGIVYTSVVGILIEVDTVSSILGISLADGKTFKDNGLPVTPTPTPTYEPVEEPKVEEPKVEEQQDLEDEEYTVTEEPKEEQVRETVVVYEDYEEEEEPLEVEDDEVHVDIEEQVEEVEDTNEKENE